MSMPGFRGGGYRRVNGDQAGEEAKNQITRGPLNLFLHVI